MCILEKNLYRIFIYHKFKFFFFFPIHIHKNDFSVLQMCKRRVTSLTVEEILGTLEEVIEDEDVETADAVIIPPEADTLTDNEDIDDDCTGNVDVDGVAGTLEKHVVAQIINDDVNDNETRETPGIPG